MRYHIGFSTGAVALGDFRSALDILLLEHFNCVELSALRMSEVDGLLASLTELDLKRYTYISFHAPSSIPAKDEFELADKLSGLVPKAWPIVLHPDTISDYAVWRKFGSQLAIENMDRRKQSGRDVRELEKIFDLLPEASFCFDIGHARQCDSSMTEADSMLRAFGTRLVQLHVSEVNSHSQHDPISYGAQMAFRQVAHLVPEDIPLIVESRVDRGNSLRVEAERAIDSLSGALISVCA